MLHFGYDHPTTSKKPSSSLPRANWRGFVRGSRPTMRSNSTPPLSGTRAPASLTCMRMRPLPHILPGARATINGLADWRCAKVKCRDRPSPNVLRASATNPLRGAAMLYAILAYHVEGHVTSFTPAEDAALMRDLNEVHQRFLQKGMIGPAVRLGETKGACVLRGPGKGIATDGPFTESKEQLLGFYIVDCADRDAAISA